MAVIQKIDLPRFEDGRGIFQKIFSVEQNFLKSFQVKQINKVTSRDKGVLRGLHYQEGYHAEAKLFHVSQGKIQLVAFCVDKSSEYYRRSSSFFLEPKDPAILIPRGYATGYLVLEAFTDVIYCSDNIYHPPAERGIRWNDSCIRVSWAVDDPELSDKDQKWEDFDND